jgi:hypothetical protein
MIQNASIFFENVIEIVQTLSSIDYFFFLKKIFLWTSVYNIGYDIVCSILFFFISWLWPISLLFDRCVHCLYLHKEVKLTDIILFSLYLSIQMWVSMCRSHNLFVPLTDNNSGLAALSFCSYIWWMRTSLII